MGFNIPMVVQKRISLEELADMTERGESVKKKQVGPEHIGNITIYSSSNINHTILNTQVNGPDLSGIFTSGRICTRLVDIEFTWGLKGASQNYVIETEAFMLDQNGNALGDDWFIFYGSPKSPDGAICLLESTSSIVRKMQLDVNKIDRRCQKIALTMTIDDENHNGYSFRDVYNIRVVLRDRGTHKVVQKFNLPEFQGNPNAVSLIVAEIYRHGMDWGISMVGEGNPNDLLGLCQYYHIDAGYN